MNATQLLIIDDEPEVTQYLKTYFEQKGIKTLTAATGEEALELITSANPSLVILDIRLGRGFSGLEVLRRAKRAKSTAEFIVLSAVGDRNMIDMAMGLGAVSYITKPIVIADLDRIVLSRLKPSH